MRTVHIDCRYFLGDKPCKPHLETGIFCENCQEYNPVKFRILIINLGPSEKIIQTTALLRALKKNHPDATISWLTRFTELLSKSWIDDILSVTTEAIEWLKANTFDWMINLDTDPLAISLAEQIQAAQKSGFGMDKFGHCRPLDEDASCHKWQTLLWQDLKTANRMHYLEEIFLICGLYFNGEETIEPDEKYLNPQ